MNYARRSLVVALLAGSIVRVAAADEVALKAGLDRAIDSAIAEQRIVGTVVIASVDGKIVYTRAAGFADREAQRPMTEDTLFRLASVSKPIVTAAVLALLDQGKLRLDDPVTKYLPTFRPKLADGREPTITLRQLMTHTAGLAYGFGERADGPYRTANVTAGLDQPGVGMDEAMRRIASAPLFFEPGDRFNYSVGIDVLGAVAEKAAGKPLGEIVRETIAEPLDAKDLLFAVDRSEADRLATPYAAGPGGPVPMGEKFVMGQGDVGIHFEPARAFDAASFPSGGAGMIGSAAAVHKLLESIRAGGEPILKPETAQAMLSNQLGEKRVGPGMTFGFGGAILIDPAAARSPLSPGSWTWGGVYGHNWFVDPARKLTVVALTNSTPEGMNGKFTTDVRDAAIADGR